MEADDVLADYVYVRRPVLVVLFAAGFSVEAERGNVVRQRVEPNVNDVLGVEIDRNPPFEGGTGNAEVLQPRHEEIVDHLFFARFRHDEIGMLLDMLHESVLIFAHLEEIGFLVLACERASAVGADAALRLRIREKRFAGDAVPALIGAFVDIALIVETFEDFLHGLYMVIVRCADEVVVAAAQHIPNFLDFAGDAVHVFLRRDAGFPRQRLDFLAVLVGSGAEKDVVALRALITGDCVGEHDLIGVADMRLARCIGDRRGDIILSFVFHCLVILSNAAANEPCA